MGIHAAQTEKGMHEAAENPKLWKACLQKLPWDHEGNLPFKAIVATATLQAYKPTEELDPDIYGNFEPGRFGWIFTHIKRLKDPLPCNGRQRIFKVQMSNIKIPPPAQQNLWH